MSDDTDKYVRTYAYYGHKVCIANTKPVVAAAAAPRCNFDSIAIQTRKSRYIPTSVNEIG